MSSSVDMDTSTQVQSLCMRAAIVGITSPNNQQALRDFPVRLFFKLKKKLEGYSCKQLLKDSYTNFTLTLKVNTLWLVCIFKEKPLRSEKVNATAQSNV